MSQQPTKAELAARERERVRRANRRARRRMKKLNRRERALNLGKDPIVVRLPGPPRATAGQQSGTPMGPGRGSMKPWAARRAAQRRAEREREEAARG